MPHPDPRIDGLVRSVRASAPSFRTAVTVSLMLTLHGCRGVVSAYGGDAATARRNADALALALEQRFTDVVRTPKFAAARGRLGRYALSPSKLVSDTSLWTSAGMVAASSAGATSGAAAGRAQRTLELAASLTDGHYVFQARPNVQTPRILGDARHLIRLTDLGDDEWRWTTHVENAIGGLPPERVDAIARALFLASERPASAVRSDYRSAFPRTTAALGRLFSLDSLSTQVQPDASTLVTMQILTRSEGIRSGFPAFARYIDKYVAPARYRFLLTDRAGGQWFDAQAEKSRLVIRFRSRGGALQPLTGPARAMPDSLLLNVDALTKLSVFTVGVTAMRGDFVQVATNTERGWAMRFTREPDWHLPLIGERLLRSPLARPFRGNGIVFNLGFRSTDDGNTLLARDFNVTVQESTVMRFLGNLGFTAMNDYAGRVEDEENRFFAGMFRAMRADLREQ